MDGIWYMGMWTMRLAKNEWADVGAGSLAGQLDVLCFVAQLA